MFYSIYLMIPLLVNIVQIGSTIEIPPSCDLSKKPTVKKLDVKRYAGKWYLKAMTAPFPDMTKLTSLAESIAYYKNKSLTVLHFVLKMSFIDQTVCIMRSFPCVLNGSTCLAPGIDDNYELIAIDYNHVRAIWSKYSDTYQILSLYARDPFTQPKMKGIQYKLKKFCGAPAADPTSSFYTKKFDYKDHPCKG